MGNPFCHMELSTGNVDAAKKFYKHVFNWKLEEMKGGGMPYTMIQTVKGSPGGGITKIQMEGQPPAWLVYAEVDSVNKTIAKVEKAGGKALVPYMSIGDMGAIGVFVDPTGAAFGVWEAAKKPAKKAAAKKAPAKKAPAKKAAKKK